MSAFKGGNCYVANGVIDTIIALTAAKVDGVESVAGFDASSQDLRYNSEKYIQTKVNGSELETALTISVAADYSIIEVAKKVQKAVVEEIDIMLGLSVSKVDVTVDNWTR